MMNDVELQISEPMDVYNLSLIGGFQNIATM